MPERDRSLPRRTALGYALGDLGISLAYFAVGFFFLFYLMGYQTLEGSWVLEFNRRTIRLARLLGAKPGREFALYSSSF